MSALEFTRDRRSMADKVRKLQGRRGIYVPPRSALEEEQMRAATSAPGGIEGVRSLVVRRDQGCRHASSHLGEGRKTLIVLSEGFTPLPQGRDLLAARPAGGRRDSDDPALDLVRTANDSNVAIHVVDPMGLQMSARGRTSSFRRSPQTPAANCIATTI